MSSKKFVLSFFVLFFFFLMSSLYGEQIYHFKALDYQIETTKENFHRISIDGYYSYAVPGYPNLPSKIFRVAVPPDVLENSIRVEYSPIEIIPLGKFKIMELPPMVTWIDGKKIIGRKVDIYSKDSYYPEKIVEHLGFSQMRKWRMVNLKYTPFQYNPVTGDLIYVSEVEIRIRYYRIGMGAVLDSELADEVMDSRAQEILMNYSEAKEWYRPSEIIPKPLVTYDYVIITTNSINTNSTKLNDFVNYLTSKGYSPLVITESDYGGLEGQSPNGTAEKIREWLKNYYQSYSTKYVLLIGNPDPTEGDVPMKMCWPRINEEDTRESPTDYFYSDLTGNWDLNGNGYFGEYPEDQGAGGVDFMSEVYVGRIPVYSNEVTTLDSILNKMINYGNETDVTWRKRILLPMSYSDAETDGAYLGEAMKWDYLTDFAHWTLYMKGSVCPEADSSFSSDEELLDSATLTRWMNNPYGMVWWWGHGSPTEAALGYEDCGWGTIMRSSNAPSLNDNYPSFVYQCSCNNGYPEDSENLGYALLKNGAIATVCASRVSWYAVTSWYAALKYYCDNASIGYYYGYELVTNNKKAGQALFDVKSDMGANSYTWWGGAHWMNLFDMNLYGHPAEISPAEITRKLTISAGTGGTTDPAPGTYTTPDGAEVKVTAIPQEGYRFKNWSGDASGTDNPITITMNSDKSITANFIRVYKLTLASGTGGTTDPAPGEHIYDEGTKVTIKAIPDTHYEFKNWSEDASGTDETLTITMNSDKSIAANFTRIIYAPLSFNGAKVENRSLFLVEYINNLTWQANLDNINIVKYRIYQVEGGSRSLLVELDANTFEYWHRKVEKDKSYSYSIVAVNDEGREGDPASITVQ